MRFALVNNTRTEAEPGLAGSCQGCSRPVIAKCGEQRVHHWAHKKKMCDNWWEPETEWHRKWKDKFPKEWQEIYLPDEQTGEKHIADIRTADGLVIEFQHSNINPVERLSRERFYQNMLWVVDGNRLKRDYQRFFSGSEKFKRIKPGFFVSAQECFSTNWTESSVPVFFDFAELPDQLFGLMPIRFSGNSVIIAMSRAHFIATLTDGKFPSWLKQFLTDLSQFKQEYEQQES